MRAIAAFLMCILLAGIGMWPVAVMAVQELYLPQPEYMPMIGTSDSITVYLMPDQAEVFSNYLHYLPDLEEAPVATNAKPTEVYRGVQHGFSMPVWADDNEELFFNIVVPSFWDGESDIVVYCDTAIDTANTDKNYRMALDWEHWTPEYDTVPSTNTTVLADTATGSGNQYQSYRLNYNIDYDVHGAGNEIEAGDIIAFRLRRLGAVSDEASGEVVMYRSVVGFKRGDLDDYLTSDIIASTYVADSEVEELALEIAESVDIFSMLVQLAMVALVVGLAFWKKHIILYILAGAATMTYGIYYSAQGAGDDLTVYLWLGIGVAGVGLYMLYRVGVWLLGRG